MNEPEGLISLQDAARRLGINSGSWAVLATRQGEPDRGGARTTAAGRANHDRPRGNQGCSERALAAGL